MVKVFLKHGRDESLRRFHPWVFSGAVAQVQGSPAEGDIVGVYSAEGQFLASGHWQVGSIAVRILSFDADPTAPGFWVDSISRALEVRRSVGLFAPGSQGSRRQNFASLIPPTAPQRVPPVHEATGGHGSAGQTLAAPTDEAPAATAPGNPATLGMVRGGTASEAQWWGPAEPDVSGGQAAAGKE